MFGREPCGARMERIGNEAAEGDSGKELYDESHCYLGDVGDLGCFCRFAGFFRSFGFCVNGMTGRFILLSGRSSAASNAGKQTTKRNVTIVIG